MPAISISTASLDFFLTYLKILFMAERNKITQALILSIREQGEKNWSVCALSPDLGIFYGTLYGGAKSKLKSMVQPFNSGTIFIYDDENRGMRKISDFDVKNFHTSLKENLYKTWAANLAAEIVLKTKCAGEDRESFVLLSAFIDGIDSADENVARVGTIRFLWRYISLLGVQPELIECCTCGTQLIESSVTNPQSEIRMEGNNCGKYHFIPALNGLVCHDCQDSYIQNKSSGATFFEMTTESLKYLDAINNQSPGQVRRLPLSLESINDLKRLTFYLIENAVGSPLLSMESGYGIL